MRLPDVNSFGTLSRGRPTYVADTASQKSLLFSKPSFTERTKMFFEVGGNQISSASVFPEIINGSFENTMIDDDFVISDATLIQETPNDAVVMDYAERSKIFSETTLRSVVKALTWRVVAGSVTLITSLKLSGNFALALKIVASDFLSKAFTMFLGERLMNKSQAGRSSGSDSASRSLTKALIWRLFAVCNTMTAAFFLGGGNLKIASKIAGSDAIFKTSLMVIYERIWAKVEWGKAYVNDKVVISSTNNNV